VPGISVEAAHNFRDKARMKDALRAAGLPCAGHVLARSSAEAIAFAKSSGLPVVVKPPAGAGAKQTFRVETLQQLEQALRTMRPQPHDPVLVEEFMTGREYSFDSISIDGEHVFASVSCYAPTPVAWERRYFEEHGLVSAEEWEMVLPIAVLTPRGR